ncbi:hypothetical protein [Methylocystis sp.]|uniref:hypothetical protein n=1 Tax=Methylocystis sp. TaxID=1911079 RepID=UPI003DA34E07
MEHTQFFWPLIGGKALTEAGRELVSIEDALASGLHCASEAMLAREREAEIEGRGDVASEAAQHGFCLDYEYAGPRRPVRKPKAAKFDKPHSTTPSPSPEPEQPLSPYAAAILALDEARVRPAAARTLLRMHQDESTLSIPDAAALLAALPFETREPIEAPTMSYSNPVEDAKAHAILVRATELRQQGLSLRAARGDAEARAEALRLDTALRMSRTRGTNIVAELTNAGANVAPIAEQARRVAA